MARAQCGSGGWSWGAAVGLGAEGLWGRQPGLRLILVGVHPFSLGDRCGPSGKEF